MRYLLDHVHPGGIAIDFFSWEIPKKGLRRFVRPLGWVGWVGGRGILGGGGGILGSSHEPRMHAYAQVRGMK